MAVKIYKPITPGLRGMTGYTFEEITKNKPERSLIVIRKNHAGRNSDGRITVRHRGGGERRYIRIVDMRRDKIDVP
ncbi:MAG TPA: 50S ribosomal protein L2, partial [Flexilinea sp.]|nr:50S ribosomal protein L2 [Flexilinea sp.]